MAADPVVIEHPNRDKPESKATRVVVILLLIASAGLVAVIQVGGWHEIAGAVPVTVAFVLVFAAIAYYVVLWNRGVLPVAAALAMLMLIFAAVAGPGWFDRDKAGFADSAIPADVLGVLTFVLIPVEALLIVFAMRGFSQAWNVEVERRPDGSRTAVT